MNNFQIHLNNGTSYGWNDICFKIPIIRHLTTSYSARHRRSPSDGDGFDDDFDSAFDRKTTPAPKRRPFNPSVDLSTTLFCSVVDRLPMGCMLNNILELWDFNEDKINKLTRDDVLNALNNQNVSLTTGHDTDFSRLLSGVVRNESGHVVAADGLLSHWMVYVNFSDVNHDKVGNMAGTEDWVRISLEI